MNSQSLMRGCDENTRLGYSVPGSARMLADNISPGSSYPQPALLVGLYSNIVRGLQEHMNFVPIHAAGKATVEKLAVKNIRIGRAVFQSELMHRSTLLSARNTKTKNAHAAEVSRIFMAITSSHMPTIQSCEMLQKTSRSSVLTATQRNIQNALECLLSHKSAKVIGIDVCGVMPRIIALHILSKRAFALDNASMCG